MLQFLAEQEVRVNFQIEKPVSLILKIVVAPLVQEVNGNHPNGTQTAENKLAGIEPFPALFEAKKKNIDYTYTLSI